MTTWKVVSGIALVLVVGILLGSLGTQLYIRHNFPPPPPRERPKAAEFLMKRLSKELSLTEDQAARVKQILEQTDERLTQHFQQTEPQVKSIIDDGFGRIRETLAEDQQVRFDEFRQRLERHRPKR
jgi:nucleoid DNA-binding protein